jgi:hypothetical protein
LFLGPFYDFVSVFPNGFMNGNRHFKKIRKKKKISFGLSGAFTLHRRAPCCLFLMEWNDEPSVQMNKTK